MNENTLKSLSDKFSQDCAKLKESPPPKILYHYCESSTFFNIWNNSELWNTHILDMRNDSAEFRHGMKMFMCGLELLIKKGLDKVLVKSLKREFIKEMKNPTYPPYIFCLTPKRDQVSQWIQYSEKGKGLSIGFDSNYFTGVRSVIYDDSTKRRVVITVVSKFRRFIISLSKLNINLNDKAMVRSLCIDYFLAAYIQSLRFKKLKWRNENEWRAVVILKKTDPPALERKKKCKIIRYVPTQLQPSKDVLEIITGPNFSSNTNQQLNALNVSVNITNSGASIDSRSSIFEKIRNYFC